MTPIGKKLSPILLQLEEDIWDWEFDNENHPPEFTNTGFRGAMKIFMSALLDKMWIEQELKHMPQKEREAEAKKTGQAMRQLVFLKTGIDTHNLYKDYAQED